MKNPKVSVLMPVFNGERYIREAIASILSQTYTNFELIIVNDGSTDKSVEIINSYNDPRIRLYHSLQNKGLSFTRNKCIELSIGEYIAKLDCDDIALPTRLEEQVKFLDCYPEFGMIGSWVQIIDENGKVSNENIKYTASAKEIPSILFFHNYFTQSAVMIRKSALPQNWYREEFPPAEDYDLWVRIAQNYKVWNLAKILSYYRLHNTNISKLKADSMMVAEKKILDWQLRQLQVPFTNEEFEIYFSLSKYKFQKKPAYLNDVKKCLAKLKVANQKLKKYDEKIFNERLDKLMYVVLNYYRSKVFNQARRFSYALLKDFYMSAFSHFKNYNNLFQLIFVLRCLAGWKRRI